MYKTRLNNVFKDKFENEFDARKEALLSFNRDPKLNLVEVLDEDDNVILSKSREVSSDNEIEQNAKDTLIRDLITKCYDLINDYSSAKITLVEEDLDDEKVCNAIDEMLDNLNISIGTLTSCLSDYMEK